MTYKDAIIESLKALGGHAYYKDIYQKFSEIYDGELTKTWKQSIQSVIERHSSNSSVFAGSDDVFEAIEGIGKGHWGLKNHLPENYIELSQEDDEFAEGKILLKKHLRRERNVKLIRIAKNKFIAEHGRLYCEVCGFDFEKQYGKLGIDFIEAHHIKPISEMAENEITKVDDIVMLCSNCHSMIHRRKPWLKKEDLQNLIK